MKRLSTWVSVGVLVFILAAPAVAKTLSGPPVAKRGTTVDHVFGHDIPDPYRWMEGDTNPDFITWLSAQGAAGSAWFNGSSEAAWQTKLKEVGGATSGNGRPTRAGGRLFYGHVEGGGQAVLKERLADGTEKTLFDPNTQSQDGGHVSMTNYAPSPDGKTVAVNVDRGGNEITTIEFYNTDTGAKLPDEIGNIWGEFPASWLPDGSGVAYTQMAPPGQGDPLQNMRLRFHKMGSDVAGDATWALGDSNAGFPVSATEFPVADISYDSDWELILATGAHPEARVCVARLADLAQAVPAVHCLIGYDDSVSQAEIHGSTLYVVTTKDHPNGQLMAIDLSDPNAGMATAKPVLAEDPAQVITAMYTARDAVYVRRMVNGDDTWLRLTYDGAPPQAIAMPFTGSSYFAAADNNDDGLVFSDEGWTRPLSIYAYDPATQASIDLNLTTTSPKDYTPLVEDVETEIRSYDGTMVPVSILRPRGKLVAGQQLVLLDGYGAYGTLTDAPYFSPIPLEWVAAGHTYVFVGVRGGGEKGEAWHLAGKGLNKHKGVEDLAATADYMVSSGYTTVSRIGISGASAAGALIGGAVTQFPGHFGAAIIHAGILNPTRFAVMPNGPNQYSEFGDPTTADGFESLYRMDPYLNVKSGLKYPPVMLEVGVNDHRVVPWNSGKFGAAMLHAGAPVIFRVEGDTGHFGTSLDQAAMEDAAHYAYFEKTLGATHKRKKKH